MNIALDDPQFIADFQWSHPWLGGQIFLSYNIFDMPTGTYVATILPGANQLDYIVEIHRPSLPVTQLNFFFLGNDNGVPDPVFGTITAPHIRWLAGSAPGVIQPVAGNDHAVRIILDGQVVPDSGSTLLLLALAMAWLVRRKA